LLKELGRLVTARPFLFERRLVVFRLFFLKLLDQLVDGVTPIQIEIRHQRVDVFDFAKLWHAVTPLVKSQ